MNTAGWYEFDSIYENLDRAMGSKPHYIWQQMEHGKWLGSYGDGSGRTMIIRTQIV